MEEGIAAAPVERLNWVKQVDGQVAVSVTVMGTTMGLIFQPDSAEALMDGLMNALPQQAEENPGIAPSPGLLSRSEAEVTEVEVSPHDDHPHAIEMHLRVGSDQGVKIRVSLREALRWQRRLQAQIAQVLRASRN